MSCVFVLAVGECCILVVVTGHLHAVLTSTFDRALGCRRDKGQQHDQKGRDC